MRAGKRGADWSAPRDARRSGDAGALVLDRDVPGSLAEAVPAVRVGALVEQEADRLLARHERGVVERRPAVAVRLVDVGRCGQQAFQDADGAAGCGVVQQRPSARPGSGRAHAEVDQLGEQRVERVLRGLGEQLVPGPGVGRNRGAAVEQQFDNRAEPAPGRELERRVAELVAGVHVGLPVDQHPGEVDVSRFARHQGERRAAVAVGRVHRGARGEEPRGDRHPTPHAGLRQRRFSPGVLGVDVRLLLDEESRHLVVTVRSRQVQCRGPRIVGRVDLTGAGEQVGHHAGATAGARRVQGRPAARVLRGDQFGVLLDEGLDRRQIPGARGVVKRRLLSAEGWRSEDDREGEGVRNRRRSAHAGLDVFRA